MFLRRKRYLCTIVDLSLACTAITGCSINVAPLEYADNPTVQRETVVQISTIEALLGGVYDRVVTFKTLKKYGDFGIGTFEGLDGEMVGFDGKFYQIKADGIAYPVPDSVKTPFASVTFFDTDLKKQLRQGLNYEQLAEYLDGILPTRNIFYAIRIEGAFSYMKTRSVPGQEKPYPPLVEVTKNQPIFEFFDMSAFGFWFNPC